ncbi:hypothetical protein N7492_005610 [Penicillium capsulatum]|uniref:Nascent polypeptide-associated complex subunit alpha-like UBA domain-containing protein n=1 Tax=Penicillium capsulatum TaxID=69766 RepID=A0A9W9IDQ6_9EURO|nr:hypothetical protein N7492_005610 [Penicillium capsulatum]KAJ6135291.1 hypothetical protein N7512_000451 [Penicillium capsulatum]
MSDPIPSATVDPDAVDQSLPANAEDRKAAAALSSLNTNEIAADASPAKGPSNANQEALGKAMSRLEIAAGEGSAKKQTAQVQKQEAEVKKAVKVAAADVAFVAEQLDLHKVKATELLKAHEGNVGKALKAFITPSIHA